jgi:hypothetical protein
MVPEAAVLVVGDDHQHPRPLGSPTQALEDDSSVGVAAQQIGVRRMPIEAPDRLVKHHRRQSARINVAQKILTVLEMLVAVSYARSKPSEVIERLVVLLIYASVGDFRRCKPRPGEACPSTRLKSRAGM